MKTPSALAWIKDESEAGLRKWEEFYRNRWQHDKIVRSTHGVNCTGSCTWQIYVKDGIVTWEMQGLDYPSLQAGLGAVFKLVAEHFPAETGVVGGLVGAAGGLGGFFPPLVMGLVKDVTGNYAIGFMLLSEFALGCLVVNVLALQRRAVALAPAVRERVA